MENLFQRDNRESKRLHF